MLLVEISNVRAVDFVL